jgi:hypothetical protein
MAWACGRGHPGETILPPLAVAGVKDDVPQVGVDSGDPVIAHSILVSASVSRTAATLYLALSAGFRLTDLH